MRADLGRGFVTALEAQGVPFSHKYVSCALKMFEGGKILLTFGNT